MTNQETSSFMAYFDVIRYFEENNHDSDNLWELIENIDGRSYLPNKIVSNRMNNMNWKKMQSEVTTHIFGLESIFTHELPEVELEDGITFGSDSAEEKAMFEWQCGGYED